MVSTRNLLVTIINIVFTVVGLFIGARILLELLAANSATPFVSWIYSVSGVLIYPFRGIFSNVSLSGGGILDLVAVIALIIYSLAAYLVLAGIDALFKSVVVEETPTTVVRRDDHLHVA